MAKRVSKSAADTKQTAAVRRTKKTKTPVKKTPVKKAPVKKTTQAVISGNTKTAKTATKTAKTATKTAPSRKKTVTGGKKKITTKTTLAAVAKISGAQAAVKPASNYTKPRKDVIRIKASAPTAKFLELGEKIKRGELKWIYYATDGEIGYHHYQKLK